MLVADGGWLPLGIYEAVTQSLPCVLHTVCVRFALATI